MDWALVTKAKVSDEITRNRNIAAGAVEAGVYIASGLVLSGAIREPGGSVLTACVFFILSQIVLIVLGHVYQRVAGYNVAKEILSGNLAAGTAFSLTLIGLALLMLKATSGDFVSWGSNLTFFAFDTAAGFVLLIALRWLTDLALLPARAFPKRSCKTATSMWVWSRACLRPVLPRSFSLCSETLTLFGCLSFTK